MRGTNKVLGGGGFHHIALRAHDFDKTVKFYTEVLGFQPTLAWGEGKGRAVMLDAGEGCCLEVFAGGGAEPKPEGSILHVALRTDNCDAAVARVRAAGAQVTMEPTDVRIPSQPHPTPARIAFFKGPDGELVEFFQSGRA